ncbi:MAG: HAMP domain-containing histidine kinase, partial [Spirosomaceae bacterium]|nr:HAMP domain-containing histidine kinase [Spirosomataceae bacterium]
IFCLVIYFEAEFHQSREFNERLRKETITSATFILSKDLLSPELFKQLTKRQITTLTNEELVILDLNGNVNYESGNTLSGSLSKDILQIIKQEGEYFWENGNHNGFGTLFELNGEKQILVMEAFDKYGISKQRNLRLMLIFGWVGIVLLSLLAGWFLSNRFLSPIKKIIQNIDKITGSQIGLRLNEGKKTDELEQLSIRFNQMLNRLEEAFNTQKAFVSHASHELRTPLTSITGQIQVSLMVDTEAAELRESMKSVLDDIQQLNKLTNNLLDLTSIKNNHEGIKYELVNLVQVLYQAQTELKNKNGNYQILMTYDEATELLPEIYANEPLIYTAILNLIDNGAKFGKGNSVEVNLEVLSSTISLTFKNFGTPISAEDQSNIFEPFKRGKNAANTKGHGVGLSLVKQIIELHKGTISLNSSPQSGTIFTINLPL